MMTIFKLYQILYVKVVIISRNAWDTSNEK